MAAYPDLPPVIPLPESLAAQTALCKAPLSGSGSGPEEGPTAPLDSAFFVVLTATLPYTTSEFGAAAQEKYKAAVASAAGTVPIHCAYYP